MDIILYLLQLIQYQHQQICWLLNFICRYIPLRQWAFDDSLSPKYQKFKIDKLPVIKTFIEQDWQFLLDYYQWKYGKPLKPVKHRNDNSIPEDTVCPYCRNTLVHKKDRKFFSIHKCVNPMRPFYLYSLKKVDPTNDFDNYYDANYDPALWVAYYNFLRPHKHNKYQVINKVDMLSGSVNASALTLASCFKTEHIPSLLPASLRSFRVLVFDLFLHQTPILLPYCSFTSYIYHTHFTFKYILAS